MGITLPKPLKFTIFKLYIFQVFSHSRACGLEFYRKRVQVLKGSEKTPQEFTLFLNNLFDALNRRFSAKEIKEKIPDFELTRYLKK